MKEEENNTQIVFIYVFTFNCTVFMYDYCNSYKRNFTTITHIIQFSVLFVSSVKSFRSKNTHAVTD